MIGGPLSGFRIGVTAARKVTEQVGLLTRSHDARRPRRWRREQRSLPS